MKPFDKREVAAALLPGALLALAALLAWLVFALAPDAEGRAALLLFALLMLAAVAGTLLRRAYLRSVRAAARLAEDAQSLLATDSQRELAADGSAETRALATVLNQFAAQRTALRNDIAAQVREASRNVEQERNRLAALMAELTQSRRRLQPRRPHPALQQPRAAAVSRAVGHADAGRRRRADRPRPLDLCRVRPRLDRARHRQRAAASGARRGAPFGAVRHRHARRPVAARADGAGAAGGQRATPMRSTASC